jgi:chemotaxis-related protein WspB
MLFLLFQLEQERYAIEASKVAEVVPLVQLKRLPLAPRGVAGVCNFHSQLVPVLDLSMLMLGRNSFARLGTRLVLVNYVLPSGATRLLGLLAEGATEIIQRRQTDFAETGVRNDGAPYLGKITPEQRGIIQWIDVAQLLPQELRDRLFVEAEALA